MFVLTDHRMYRHWKSDPKSVHASWATYFSGLDKGLPSSSAYTPPPGFIGAASSVSAPPKEVKGGSDLTDYLKVSQDPLALVDIRCNFLSEPTKFGDTTSPTSILYILLRPISIPVSLLN